MARATTPFCNVYYTLEFDAAIRGHHIYQSRWTPTLDMNLKCEFDKRSEAAEYDENAICVYTWGEEGQESGLVGPLPIELSKLLKQFLDVDKKNMLIVTVIGKRKREVGLVVPGRYTAMTEGKEIIDVLNRELVKKKEKYKIFELKCEEKSVDDFKKKAVFG